jgi:hypothetical protein
MGEVKTSSSISRRHTVGLHATQRELAVVIARRVRRVCTGRAMAVRWGHGPAKGRHHGPASWTLTQ